MAMTDDERRKARNEASRRWYQAHKAAKAAKSRLPKAKGIKFTKTKPAGTDKIAKDLDKFVDKNAKTADAYRGLVKSAAEFLGDVFKTEDEKLISKACKAFGKKLSLEVRRMPDGGKAELAVSIGARLFKVPKAKTAVVEETAGKAEPEEDKKTEKETVVAVDPSLLTGIEDGSVTAADVDAQPAKAVDEQDGDENDDEDEDSDLDDLDPDEMTDEQRERYYAREEERGRADWDEGRADAMRELEEQGSFDGYEN